MAHRTNILSGRRGRKKVLTNDSWNLDGTWNLMPTQFNTYQNRYRYFLHLVAKFSRRKYKEQSQEVRRVLKTHTEQRTLPSLSVQSLAFVPHSEKPQGEEGPDTPVRNPLSLGKLLVWLFFKIWDLPQFTLMHWGPGGARQSSEKQEHTGQRMKCSVTMTHILSIIKGFWGCARQNSFSGDTQKHTHALSLSLSPFSPPLLLSQCLWKICYRISRLPLPKFVDTQVPQIKWNGTVLQPMCIFP